MVTMMTSEVPGDQGLVSELGQETGAVHWPPRGMPTSSGYIGTNSSLAVNPYTVTFKLSRSISIYNCALQHKNPHTHRILPAQKVVLRNDDSGPLV